MQPEALDRNRPPAPPVPRVTILEILELAEEGQDILIAPDAIAHIPPAILFLAQPANEYGAVDRTRTANDPATRLLRGTAAKRGPAFCLLGPDHVGTAEHTLGSERQLHAKPSYRAPACED